MNIHEKIAAVMKDVRYLSKDGSISYGTTKYKAISEEKVTSIVRESLLTHGLVIYPVLQSHKREGSLTTVDVTYRIVNTEDPADAIEVVSSGTGSDTQDKGVGKAMTYAYKYMLLRTFAIPTGEDPDRISSAELDDRQKEEQIKKEVENAGISEVDQKALRSYLEKHGLKESVICGLYKVKALNDLSFGQYKAVVSEKNLAYFQDKCGAEA